MSNIIDTNITANFASIKEAYATINQASSSDELTDAFKRLDELFIENNHLIYGSGMLYRIKYSRIDIKTSRLRTIAYATYKAKQYPELAAMIQKAKDETFIHPSEMRMNALINRITDYCDAYDATHPNTTGGITIRIHQ